MKLGPQKHLGSKSQSEGTIQLVPKPRKMAIIIPQRRRGTREGVSVPTWCSEWICEFYRVVGPHMLVFPASLFLPPMRGAVIGLASTMLQNDFFYTRISIFVQSQILLVTRCVKQTNKQKIKKRFHTTSHHSYAFSMAWGGQQCDSDGYDKQQQTQKLPLLPLAGTRRAKCKYDLYPSTLWGGYD